MFTPSLKFRMMAIVAYASVNVRSSTGRETVLPRRQKPYPPCVLSFTCGWMGALPRMYRALGKSTTPPELRSSYDPTVARSPTRPIFMNHTLEKRPVPGTRFAHESEYSRAWGTTANHLATLANHGQTLPQSRRVSATHILMNSRSILSFRKPPIRGSVTNFRCLLFVTQVTGVSA